jgi:RimJ/RimL family protein N-acetyltransferase
VRQSDRARPVLVTDRLTLSPLTQTDLPHLVELNGDPEVMRYITGHAMTPAEVAAELPGLVDSERGLRLWTGYDADSSFAGVWFLSADPDDPDAGELGWRLPRSVWGQGLAAEGARPLIEHGFVTLGLSRLWAETMAVNTRSRRVMEKLGMRHVRTEVGEWDDPIPGGEQGEVVYELTREHHLASAAADGSPALDDVSGPPEPFEAGG